jgi:hypothetical protein
MGRRRHDTAAGLLKAPVRPGLRLRYLEQERRDDGPDSEDDR